MFERRSHVYAPANYDPESLPTPSITDYSKMPPCGNDFDALGCVCQGWNSHPVEIYEDHCGRFECVLGCVCDPSAPDAAVSVERRREKAAMVGINDVGVDEKEENCVVFGRRMSVGEKSKGVLRRKDERKASEKVVTVGHGQASLSDILIEIDEEPVPTVQPSGLPASAVNSCQK